VQSADFLKQSAVVCAIADTDSSLTYMEMRHGLPVFGVSVDETSAE